MIYLQWLLRLLVLPLTREWIEIHVKFVGDWRYPFSLLRGSGLKSTDYRASIVNIDVLPLTREWIEMTRIQNKELQKMEFSLLRGSGLK